MSFNSIFCEYVPLFSLFNTLRPPLHARHTVTFPCHYKSREYLAHSLTSSEPGTGSLWRERQERFLQRQGTGSSGGLQSPLGCSAYFHPLVPVFRSNYTHISHNHSLRPRTPLLVLSSAAPICDGHNLRPSSKEDKPNIQAAGFRTTHRTP